MSKEVKLRIVLQNPVNGVMYGLQKGKGPQYETVLAQIGDHRDLIFDFAIQIKTATGNFISPGGPFVQGTSGSRFVYIGIGSYAGQIGAPWNGRLKVPLPEANFPETISNNDEYCWLCTVPGRNEEGKPVFATVKPFGGWSIAQP